MSKSWADEQTARIAAEIKALRGKRSGKWLADRTSELGHPVSRTTISELETGKRKSVTVAELLVLAAALQVPPLQLVFPDLPFGEVEALPGVMERSVDAALWATGLAALRQESDHAQIIAESISQRTKLGASLRLLDLEDQVSYTKAQFEAAEEHDQQAKFQQYTRATEQLQRQMEDLGLVPKDESRAIRRRAAYERAQARVDARIEQRGEQSDG